MGEAGASRAELIKGVWPDKALFGATLLSITALLGILHGAAFTLLDITIAEDATLPSFVTGYPAELVLVLSVVAGLLGWVALARQESRLAMAGCAAGILSFSLFGLGSLLSLIALGFVFWSKAEGEDVSEEAAGLEADMWPDKALAASAVLAVDGVLTVGWGLALAADTIAFTGYTNDPILFGWLATALGALVLVAAALVYQQRAPLVAMVACLGGIAALGLYAIGPLLSLAALGLLYQAWREKEFSEPVAA